MNILKTTIFATLVASIPSAAVAETWSLDSCVSYAVSHNITVKAQQLGITDGELSVVEAKDRFLPTLSANAGESVSFGRGLTASNTYANRNTSNFQWGASLSLPLFQGLSAYRQVKVAESNLQKLLYEHEAAKDNVTLNVIMQYLQVLYAKEVHKSAQTQLSYSTYETERQRALVEMGKVAEADLYTAEAQRAQDTLQVVTTANDIRVALVNLANLLQLPTAEGFDISPIAEGEPLIPTAEAVYHSALTRNHSILASRQGIEVADRSIELAKSGYLPRLSFNAGLGSSYYTVSGTITDSFGTQMRQNYSTYFGLNLQIPIFDAFSTRNSIKKAKLQRTSAELELDRQSSELYKTIQLAYYEARGARDKYFTSLQTLEKLNASFEAMREKYNLGRATPTEFEQAKNNLFRTQISSIQAHYEYLLRHRILLFYQNNSL